jgi:hypothetical protein
MMWPLSIIVLVIVLVTGLSSHAWAQPSIRLSRVAGRLNVIVSDLDYPENFSKDLKSGLTTVILAQVVVREASAINGAVNAVAETYSVDCRYDLWDELYRIKILGSQGVAAIDRQTKSQDEAVSILKNLKLELTGKDFARLDANRIVVVEGRVLLNPIQQERVQKIRQWIAQNTVTSRQDPAGLGYGTQGSPSRFNEVFSSILQQYGDGKTQIATWQRVVTSQAFLIKDLRDEKP